MEYELYHHGILGQKWGKRNGPPYPLDEEDHSKREVKENYKKSLGGGRNEELYDRNEKKFKLTEKQKKYIKIGAAAVGAAVLIYGAYKLNDLGYLENQKKIINNLKMSLNSTVSGVGNKTIIKSPLSIFEKNSLKDYTGNWYKYMNELLREGKTISIYEDSIAEDVKNIQNAFEKSTLKKDTILHRGITPSVLEKVLGSDMINKINEYADALYNSSDKVGYIPDLRNKIFLDKGFMSTSMSSDVAKNFSKGGVVIDFIGKAGQKAIDLSKMSHYPHEMEILFKDSSAFDFTGVYEIIDDTIHLYANIIQ